MDRYSWRCDRCGVEKQSQYVIQYEVDEDDKKYAEEVVENNAEITSKRIKINREFEREGDIARQSVETYNKSHILKKKFVKFSQSGYVTREGYRIDTIFCDGIPTYREICGSISPIPGIRHIKCDSCGYRSYL